MIALLAKAATMRGASRSSQLVAAALGAAWLVAFNDTLEGISFYTGGELLLLSAT